MIKKILIYQQELFGIIPENDIQILQNAHADFICLPEYFFHPEKISYDEAIALMSEYSQLFNCTLICGTTVLKENDNLFNTCYIFHQGEEIGHYRKINLFYRELGRITPGNENKVIEVQGIRVGLMICADALSDAAWEGTAKLKPQIIFIPTFSPYKEETVQSKFIRDEEIYVSGAKFCNCPVIKTCCIGTFKDTRLQGRSLAAAPDGIIWRVQPEDEDKSAIKILDIDIPSLTC